MKLISTTVLLVMESGLIEEKQTRQQGLKTELTKNTTTAITETEIMTTTITITEGIEGEEVSLATCSTLTSNDALCHSHAKTGNKSLS